MRLRKLALGFFLVATTPLLALHDAIVNLIDGRIEDLPAQYQPAAFDPKSGALRIGQREVTLSPFLRGLFPEDGAYELQMTASWYHDRADGPYYLGFHITPKGKDFSYKFRLDLDTLRLLSVQVEVLESKGVIRVFDIAGPETTSKTTPLPDQTSPAVKLPGRWINLDEGRRRVWIDSFPYPVEYNEETAPKPASPLAP